MLRLFAIFCEFATLDVSVLTQSDFYFALWVHNRRPQFLPQLWGGTWKQLTDHDSTDKYIFQWQVKYATLRNLFCVHCVCVNLELFV